MSRLFKHASFSALQFKEFRFYIAARFFFILVLTMQATLISWKVYDITKDPFSIGLIGLFEFFPAFIMAFYAGYIIDKSDKRKLLVLSIGGNLLLTGLFAFITSHYAENSISKHSVLYTIYAISFCTGIARAFSGPTSFALIGSLISREEMSNAITWHSGIWQVSSVGGPALAGIMLTFIGMEKSFLLMLFMILLAFILTVFISPKKPHVSATKEKMLESLKQGFRFVWRTKEVLGVMSLDLFAVFFGGATAMLPYFSDVILKTGPAGLGILRSAPALGAVTVYILINFMPLNKNQGRNMLFCVAGFGATIIIFGLSKYFWLSTFALFLSGLLDGVSMLVRSSALQLKTPENMKGRVSALNSIFVMSSNELGAFESGFASKLMGVIPSVVFGGMITIGIVIFTWVKIPSVKKMNY